MTVQSIRSPAPATAAASDVTQQGMISPGDQFVDPATGMLMPVSFRFLFGMFTAIAALQAQNAALQERLTNAGIA